MAANLAAESKAALAALSQRQYEMQAKHFLNAFWERKVTFMGNDEECEKIWHFHEAFCKTDKKKRDKGNELDEFEAHQLLEHEVGAMTVKDMRAALQAIDIDFNRMMSMTEFLIFHYKLDIADVEFLVNWCPAGSPAQRAMLEKVQAQMKTAQAALAASTEAAEAAKVEAEKSAVAAEASAKAADESEAAAKEQAEATKALEAQEKAKADAIDAQEKLSNDESLSTVKRNKAKAQCAILKAEDSQPLRTARITQGAAERKAKKAAKKAKLAADAADAAMKIADDAVHELTDKLEEAKAMCAGGGSEEGTFWWLDREFDESLKYMGPKQKDKALAARAAARKRSGTVGA